MFAIENEKKIEDSGNEDEKTKKKKKGKKSKKTKSDDDDVPVFVHDTTTCDVYRAIGETWPKRWQDSKLRNEAMEETAKRLEIFRQDKGDCVLRPKVEHLPPLKKRLVPSWNKLFSTSDVQRVLSEDVTTSVKSRNDEDEKRKDALRIERSKVSESIETWNSGSPVDDSVVDDGDGDGSVAVVEGGDEEISE